MSRISESRIFDFFKGLISLALIVALLVGIPALLLVIVGFPLPTEMPSFQLIRRHIEDGMIPDLFVIKTLAVVVWIVWIQLAVAVLTELFAMLRGRTSGRAPVLPGIQLFAGKLVASTVLIVSALTPARSAAAAPIVPLDAAPAAATVAAEQTGSDLIGPSRNSLSLAIDPAADGTGGAQAQSNLGAVADRHYETKNSDNWWDMAERLLGDGMRWSELRDLNSGKVMLTGEVISSQTENVRGGWRLAVPADADPRLLSTNAEPPADAELPADTELPADAELPADTELPADAEPPADEDVQTETSSPIMRALRPDTLVYEGPTGVVDSGPGVPYQVVEGDNLWDIAERHLGDPFRWPEIFENSNQLQQTFGRQISDPNLIWPDSILWLPTDAVDVPAADVELVVEVVGPVEPLSESTEPTAIQPEELQAVTAAARDAASGLDLSPAGNPTGGIDHGPGGGPGGDGGRPVPESSPTQTPPESAIGTGEDAAPQRSVAPVGAAFGAGGLLVASGLFGMLHRARRLRLSQSGEGSQPAPPPLELTDIETVLRNRSDGRRSQSIHHAIASLANRTVIVGEPVAAPEVIRVSGDRIEVVQRGHDSELPKPWLAARSPALDFLTDRSLAVLPAEFFPQDSEDDSTEIAAPGCVTIGRGLMVNLEVVGVVAIDGPTDLAAGLIRSMVHELATGPARRTIDIFVSDWLPGADLHEHVRCGPLDNLADQLQPWLEDAELAITAAGAFSAYAMRVAGLGDSVPNSTVIFADAADAESIAPLVERARRHALPLSIVFSGDLDQLSDQPETTIELDAETMRLEPYGFTAAMQYLDVDLVLGAEALVTHARQAPMVRRNDESTIVGLSLDDVDQEHDTDPAQVRTEETPEHEIATELPAEEHEITDQAEDPDSGLLVRVLGPVEVDGLSADLSDAELSLVTFLALAGPSTADQIREAVWPGDGIDDRRFDATVDRLKQILGPRFSEVGDGRYRLRSTITDLGSARRWIAQARSMSDDRARNLLQLALADVRGEPFSGVPERFWQWVAEHRMALAAQAGSLLMDACFELCDSAYDANDIYLAKWACEIASLVDPLNETVVTRRVQLLEVLGSSEEAGLLVADWETRFEQAASRPAPHGPRMALGSVEAAPYVG